MITTVIVDDEQKSITTLEAVLRTHFPNVQVLATSTTVADAVRVIPLVRPQLLLLDIEMGMESGFDVLEKLPSIPFQVAFITAHEEYALRAIKLSAIDYIIKPAAVSDLQTLFGKVEGNVVHDNPHIREMFGNARKQDKREHKIALAVAEGYTFVKVMNIAYLMADGSYTILHMTDGSEIVTSKGLKHYDTLLDEYGFFRIHNSTLVNLECIKKVSKTAGGSVIMEDNVEFSISKSRREAFLDAMSLR